MKNIVLLIYYSFLFSSSFIFRSILSQEGETCALSSYGGSLLSDPTINTYLDNYGRENSPYTVVCYNKSSNYDVWKQYQVPIGATGVITVQMISWSSVATDVSPMIQVFSNCFTPVHCMRGMSPITFSAVPYSDSPIYVRLGSCSDSGDSSNTNTQGSGSIRITLADPPATTLGSTTAVSASTTRAPSMTTRSITSASVGGFTTSEPDVDTDTDSDTDEEITTESLGITTEYSNITEDPKVNDPDQKQGFFTGATGVGIILGIVVLVSLIGGVIGFILWRKNAKKRYREMMSPNDVEMKGQSRAATNIDMKKSTSNNSISANNSVISTDSTFSSINSSINPTPVSSPTDPLPTPPQKNNNFSQAGSPKTAGASRSQLILNNGKQNQNQNQQSQPQTYSIKPPVEDHHDDDDDSINPTAPPPRPNRGGNSNIKSPNQQQQQTSPKQQPKQQHPQITQNQNQNQNRASPILPENEYGSSDDEGSINPTNSKFSKKPNSQSFLKPRPLPKKPAKGGTMSAKDFKSYVDDDEDDDMDSVNPNPKVKVSLIIMELNEESPKFHPNVESEPKKSILKGSLKDTAEIQREKVWNNNNNNNNNSNGSPTPVRNIPKNTFVDRVQLFPQQSQSQSQSQSQPQSHYQDQDQGNYYEKLGPPVPKYVDPIQPTVFGVPIEKVKRTADASVPLIVDHILNYLNAKGQNEEGILRLAGSITEIKKLKEAFDQGKLPTLGYGHDIHTVAGVLKLWFRELPTPPFPSNDALSDASECESEDERAMIVQQQLRLLPAVNRLTLKRLFSFCRELSNNATRTKMSPPNIAIVFFPTLQIPMEVIVTMIVRFDQVFN